MARAKMSSEKGQKHSTPKNINSITIIITSEPKGIGDSTVILNAAGVAKAFILRIIFILQKHSLSHKLKSSAEHAKFVKIIFILSFQKENNRSS